MVVGADDLALFDFRLNFLPRAPGVDHVGDLSYLVALVVELQDHNVRFSAIYARMLPQIPVYVFACFILNAASTLSPRRIVAILSVLVVRDVIDLLACLAHAVAAIRSLPIYGEVGELLLLLA
jgi:hypothetical protein